MLTQGRQKIGPYGSEFELFVVPNLKSCAGLVFPIYRIYKYDSLY